MTSVMPDSAAGTRVANTPVVNRPESFRRSKAAPVLRRQRFDFETDFDPRWTPRFPEVAAVANGVSLAMPYVEPFIVQAIRRVQPLLENNPTLAAQARAFVAQEAAHHAQHYRFNAAVTNVRPWMKVIERILAAEVAVLRHFGDRFATGLAAGFEMVGFTVACWLAPRLSLLFSGAHGEAARLYVWHLGEELEHRSIAHDVHSHTGGGKARYVAGIAAAIVLLATAAILGGVSALVADSRWWKPVTWWRLVSWGVSFLWLAIPILLLSLWRHPNEFGEPPEAKNWTSGSIEW